MNYAATDYTFHAGARQMVECPRLLASAPSRLIFLFFFNAVRHELRSPGEHENVAGVGAKAFVAILQRPRADRAKFVSILSARPRICLIFRAEAMRGRVFIFHLRAKPRAAGLDVLRRYELGEPETFLCNPFDKLPIAISRNPPLPYKSCLSCRKRISPTARVVEKVIKASVMSQLRAAEDETAECAEDAETAL